MLQGPYAFDRVEPPDVFYTLKEDGTARTALMSIPLEPDQPEYRFRSGHDVFVQNNRFSLPGFMAVGLVTSINPYGQGDIMSAYEDDLREATKDEVLAALGRRHPSGSHFQPGVFLLQNVYKEQYIDTLRVDVADAKGGPQGALLASHPDFSMIADEIYAKWGRLISRWPEIAAIQRAKILEKFGEKPD